MASMLGNRKHRDTALQAAFVAVIGVTIVSAVLIARKNLQIQGITVGWDFLQYATGSTISFSLIPYDISSTYARALLVGFVNTLLLGAVSISLAVILGTIIGTARLSKHKLLNFLANAYVQLFRNLPLILQAFFWYTLITHLPSPRTAFSLPGNIFISNRGTFFPILNVDAAYQIPAILLVVAGIISGVMASRRFSRLSGFGVFVISLLLAGFVVHLGLPSGAPLLDIPVHKGLRFVGGGEIIPELSAAIISISLFGASYIAEIVRGGFLAVPAGMGEAAHALGMRDWNIFWKIRLPLMIRIVLPTMTNQIIWLMKATTIGIAIGFTDFFAVISTSINNTGQTVTLILILVLGFWTINMTISVVMNAINRAIAIPGRKN